MRCSTLALVVVCVVSCAAALGQETRPAAKVDGEARGVMEQVAGAYGKLKSLEVRGTVTLVVEDGEGRHVNEAQFSSAFLSPNLFRQEMKGQPLLGCDGKKAYAWSQESNAYVQADVAAERLALSKLPPEIGEVLPAQNPSLALAVAKNPVAELEEAAEEIKVGPSREVDGRPCQAIVLTLRESKNELTLLIDSQTHLVRRAADDIRRGMAAAGRPDLKEALLTIDYTTIKTDAAVGADAFAWSAPEGAKDLVAARAEAKSRVASILEDNPASALVGKPAPDFSLEDLNGKTVKLSDLKGSVVVLDFFATWCGPCVAGLPHTDRLHQDLGKDGLKVFAVNQHEAKDKVAAFVSDKKLTLPVLLDAEERVGRAYLVSGIPQLVVIGKDGKVKKVEVGYDPAGTEKLRQFVSGLISK